MTLLTTKEQPFLRSVLRGCMPTHQAGLTGVVGIYLDGHAPMHKSFVGYHALQLSERPFRVDRIGLPLLSGRFFSFFATGSLSDVCQILQSDQTIWVSGHNAFGDHMIGVGFNRLSRPLIAIRRRVAERVPFFCRRFLVIIMCPVEGGVTLL